MPRWRQLPGRAVHIDTAGGQFVSALGRLTECSGRSGEASGGVQQAQGCQRSRFVILRPRWSDVVPKGLDRLQDSGGQLGKLLLRDLIQFALADDRRGNFERTASLVNSIRVELTFGRVKKGVRSKDLGQRWQ